MSQNKMFRKESLERLASPEQLDQLLQTVSLRSWIPLATAGGFIGLIVLWSIAGRVPVVVQGRGAFVDPVVSMGANSVVMDVQAPGSGVLKTFLVQRGSTVTKGQLLGLIDQPALAHDLAEAEAQLGEQQARARELDPMTRSQRALKAVSQQAERQETLESLRNTVALTPLLRKRATNAVESQRKALALRKQNLRSQVASAKQTLESRQALRERGLVTDSALRSAQSDYLGAVEESAKLETESRQLDTREAEDQREYLANLSKIAELKSRLTALEVQTRSGELDNESTRLASRSALAESVRRVKQLQRELKAASEIRAEVGGQILEITAVVGQLVTKSARLAGIDIAEDNVAGQPSMRMSCVSYLTIGDGMRVKPGMKVQITPDTVTREEYGGIVGKVTRVTRYPVTPEGAINVVNSAEIARELTAEGRVMEVFTELETAPDTPSGFRWTSSRGPDVRLALGTTVRSRIAIEERAPITYLLPFLRGIQK